MDLSVDLAPSRPGGLALRNPVMAAGPTGYGRELMRLVDLGTLGAVVTRLTTLHRDAGSPPPRLAGTAAGVLLGRAPNPGLRAALRDNARVWAGWPLPVILAVAGQSPAECARIGSHAEAAREEGGPGVAGLELDLSGWPDPAGPDAGEQAGGPPEAARPSAGWDPAEAWQAVHALREACALPLLVKLPWSGPALVEVARAAALAGADALTLVAPLPGLAVDTARRRVALSGGLTGPAVLPLVLHCLRAVSEALPGMPLVAADGVATGLDAAACLLAGASAVQVGSAALSDPRAPLLVLAGLEDYCREKGITRIRELVGAARS